MSTTYVSIYDLLRITYTYEAQAMVAESQSRKRTDSFLSFCPVSFSSDNAQNTKLTSNPTPDVCSHISGPNPLPSSSFAALETDFTPVYASKKGGSSSSMS
ncbi:hypothetical protein K458DRAFT_358289 [Lentithecium fluviatile CBS 122367]|uniref:Uncharacterized protein n=1 Tax=Lentithecium fluviatile CBS 122367 TaxID=1168545 RepID=A0A6G1JH70_9PLEO|nr:hypothetical protein K458DRAFT_358289 [Lentithecium fluviatile CBS 122367]